MSQASVSSAAWASIAEVDPELWAAMEAERHRQTDKIELIASENYVFQAVNEAQGSWLTNKYAEGLPGKRYYGGCEHVDVAENLARARALALFPGSDHVNVQPHSGRPGQHGRLLRRAAARRPDPGHEPGPRRPPHPRLPGQLLRPALRGARLRRGPRDRADRLRRPRGAGGARCGRRWSWRARRPIRASWDFERMAAIAHGVGALLFVDMAHVAGLVAAGLHPSPFPHADLVTTTTHKTLRGPARRPRVRPGGPAGRRRPGQTSRRWARTRSPQADRQERVPGRPGRSADARHRRQGRRAAPGRHRRVPPGPGPHDRERPRPRRDHRRGRGPPRQRRARTTTSRSWT